MANFPTITNAGEDEFSKNYSSSVCGNFVCVLNDPE